MILGTKDEQFVHYKSQSLENPETLFYVLKTSEIQIIVLNSKFQFCIIGVELKLLLFSLY